MLGIKGTGLVPRSDVTGHVAEQGLRIIDTSNDATEKKAAVVPAMADAAPGVHEGADEINGFLPMIHE